MPYADPKANAAYMKEYTATRYKTDPEFREKCAERQRRWKYKIEPEEYNALLMSSCGACYICGEVPERPLHLDHDHATGKIRGLLCQPCNHALGLMKDDKERLQKAIDYLGI